MIKTRFFGFLYNFSRHQKARFALAGTINTVVDFSVLFGLVTFLDTSLPLANIVSTSIALTISYLFNKRAVFRNTDMHNTRQVFLFITVTLFGLWVIQGVIISTISSILWVTAVMGESLMLFAAKLVATATTVIWNYTMYSRVVFRSSVSKQ